MIVDMRNAICGAMVALGLVLVIVVPARAVSLDEVDALIRGAKLVDGTEITVGPLRGKVVVATFFASWCPPCRSEFKHLNQLLKSDRGSQITVVGINLFEAWGGKKNPLRMTRFLADTKPQFAVIEGSEALRLAFGGIERIPSVIVVGTDGREAWRFVHERGSAKTNATVEDLSSALAAAGVAIASQ